MRYDNKTVFLEKIVLNPLHVCCLLFLFSCFSIKVLDFGLFYNKKIGSLEYMGFVLLTI